MTQIADTQQAEVRERAAEAERVVVLTGAGISAESGLSTFRGQEGLWSRFRPEEMATPEAFERDAEAVWQWYGWRFGQAAGAEPNRGHRALVRFAALFPSLVVVTQNVDELHQKAGSRDVLELHGTVIPKDSKVELKSSGLLGGMVAEVIPGQSSEMAKWGDPVTGQTGIGLFDKMDDLASETDKVARRVQQLLSDDMVRDLQGGAAGARASLESLQAMLKEQRGELRALSASLKRSAEGLEKVTTGPELERATKRIDALTASLEGTLKTFDRSSASLEREASKATDGSCRMVSDALI